MNDSLIAFAILVLFVAAYTDIRHRRIPNLLTYVGIAIALSTAIVFDWHGIKEPSLFQPVSTFTTFLSEVEPMPINREQELEMRSLETYQAISGATGCFAIVLLIYAAGGIGGGDVKLAAFVGAATGLEAGMSILCIGHLLAGVWGVVFFIGDFCKDDQSDSLGKGVPMAVFYFAGAIAYFLGA